MTPVTPSAIRSASRTLTGYLRSTLTGEPALTVHLDPPGADAAAGPAVSLWLYRVMLDEGAQNWELTGSGAEPMSFRLHYLVTPAAGSAEADHSVLSQVLSSFQARPILVTGEWDDEVSGRGTDVRVRFEPLTTEDLTRLWQALGSPYRLAASFEVHVADAVSGTYAGH